MTIPEQIEAALVTHMVTFNPSIDAPVVYPNMEFPEPGEEKPATYIEARHFPNRNTRLYLKGSAPHLRQGILQLTIFTPLHEGATPATTLAGEIAEHFPADLALYEDDIRLRIQKVPDIMPAERTDDGVSWSARVDCYYEVYA